MRLLDIIQSRFGIPGCHYLNDGSTTDVLLEPKTVRGSEDIDTFFSGGNNNFINRIKTYDIYRYSIRKRNSVYGPTIIKRS